MASEATKGWNRRAWRRRKGSDKVLHLAKADVKAPKKQVVQRLSRYNWEGP